MATYREAENLRKVIVTNICTLDGFYAGEGGNPMVLNMDHSFDSYNLERMRSAGTVLLGRASFDLFGSFWPGVADAPEDAANPGLSVANREFSRLYGGIPKLVVSDSLAVPPSHPWASTVTVVTRADGEAAIAAERANEGGDIVIFGSRRLWNALLASGLVDELHLIIGPRAIGEGVPLFAAPVSLDLIEARQLPGSDNVVHIYSARR